MSYAWYVYQLRDSKPFSSKDIVTVAITVQHTSAGSLKTQIEGKRQEPNEREATGDEGRCKTENENQHKCKLKDDPILFYFLSFYHFLPNPFSIVQFQFWCHCCRCNGDDDFVVCSVNVRARHFSFALNCFQVALYPSICCSFVRSFGRWSLNERWAKLVSHLYVEHAIVQYIFRTMNKNAHNAKWRQ